MDDSDSECTTLNISIPQNSKRLKILLIGDTRTGKTSIIRRYVDNKFDKNIEMTIAFDFKIKTIRHLNQNVCLHIWDISGAKYGWLLHEYVKDMDVVVFVCDVNDKESIYNIKYHWYDIIKNINLDSPFYIAVNKCECPGNNKKNYIKDFFKSLVGINNIFYISALSNGGITKMFSQIVDDIVKPKEKEIIPFRHDIVLKKSIDIKSTHCILI